jgi:hypothetical protein
VQDAGWPLAASVPPTPASAELAAASQRRPGPQAANHDGPAAGPGTPDDGTPGPVLDSPLRLGAPGVYSPLGTRHKLGVFTNRHSFWDGAGALLSRDIPVQRWDIPPSFSL